MKYEVRTKEPYTPLGYVVETKRVSRKDAEQDVQLLKDTTGKNAWIVEVDA